SLKKAQHKPDDLPKRGTIMGYAGGVNEKLDLNCIDFLANYNPTWQIVLIGKNFFKGRLAEKFEHLLKKKNIHYLGPKPWDQLPCYVKWFNVGILPYFPTNVAKWCDTPAKLFEYLAAELPIVEIGLPNPNTVDGLVEVARTPEEFAQKVENSLKEDNSEKRQIRKKIALENTWESRAKYIIDVIQNRLTGPSHGH
ncbi:MAG TPA: glycosyltransferase, partial [Bacteroidetes bacterium]|nr:glycosyltransferase [Bacteroidota bacterium]